MDLITHLESKANTQLLVNGTIYKVDAHCIVRDVKKEDAEKLLQSPAWGVVENAPKGKAKKSKGKDEDKTVPSMESAVIAADERKRLPDEDEGWSDDEDDPGEYPDPTEDMDIELLREMADAYEVSYTKRTGKKRLVQDITAAMYAGEEE